MNMLFWMLALAAPETAQSAVAGPGRICINHAMFDLVAGELFRLESAGTETASFSITSRHGRYDLQESEIFGLSQGELVLTRPDARVYRNREGDQVSYAVFGRPDFWPNEDRGVIMLSGPALRGTEADHAIYERVHIAGPDRRLCKHSYIYGWSAMSLEPDAK